MEKLEHALSQIPAEAKERAKISVLNGWTGPSLTIEWTPPPRCDKTLDMFEG